MAVDFQRTGARRYAVIVRRDDAPPAAMNPAPGYDEFMPHDLLHFVVERELGLTQGIFGQVAAGGSARTFHASAQGGGRSVTRARRRRAQDIKDDVHGMRVALPPNEAKTLDAAMIERICAALDATSRQWAQLDIGQSFTLAWPETRRHARH